MMPKVSVIIPCYNRESFIAETVESVLSQTYSNVELIAIDDGCTDNSRKILEKFNDKIKILQHLDHLNKGQSASINLGLANSDGKYVGILDSDDIWFPNKISEQVEYLEAHPEIGMVFGNGEAIDSGGHHLYNIYDEQPPKPGDPESLLMDCYIHLPSNSLIRREIYNQVGPFDENLRAAQDHDMLIRIAEVTRIAFLNRKWYQYRRHENSISSTATEQRWRGGFRILEKAIQRYPYSSQVIRKRKGVLHFRLGQCYIRSRQPFYAIWHFIFAFCYDPLRAFGVIFGRENVR